jgi:hypothetical protein
MVVTLGITVLAARHFASTGWPLEHADPLLAAIAALLLVLSYPLKAMGWRRVFRPADRPSSMSLAAANGAASVTGAALPGRFDDVVRIAVIRRYPSCPACVRTLALSLLMVGLLDAAAFMPLGAAAAATWDGGATVRAGLAVVSAAGLGAILVVTFLPRMMASGRVVKYRIARWIGQRLTHVRDAWKAALFVLASWIIRAMALFVFLAAMDVPLSFPLAIGFLCAAAAASALPIAPAAGAATQVGGGAALLVASGVSTQVAIDFALSAQALLIFAGAAVVLYAAASHGVGKVVARRRGALAQAEVCPAEA